MTPADSTTAAARYKEIIGLARQSAEQLRAWELARAAELDPALTAAADRVTAAADRKQQVSKRADQWWKMALHNVEHLTWLPAHLTWDLTEGPEPATTAHAQYLDRYLTEVKESYQGLTQAVIDLNWRARR